jgi:hypothetical protein
MSLVTKSLTSRRLLIAGCALFVATLLGCGEKVHVVPMTASEENLRNLVLAYMEASGRLNRPPKNAEDLKLVYKDLNSSEKVLVSPSDGEPYVVIWNVDVSRGGPGPYQGMWAILAYERKAKGGGRVVVDTRGRPMTVPEEDFSKLTFAGGHKPAVN